MAACDDPRPWQSADLFVVTSIAAVVALRPRPAAVAIDMPIGLPDTGPRACDVEARRRLGRRRSSVFPAPARSLLDAVSFADAHGVSMQAFNLLPRIRDVDSVITPARQRWIAEAHPELCFARLLGRPAVHPKRTPAGQAERLAALGLGAPPRVAGAAPDDVLDALALLSTAQRLANRTAERLGDGRRDGRGLRMDIML